MFCGTVGDIGGENDKNGDIGGETMKALAVAIMVAGLAVAIGLYAGLRGIASEMRQIQITGTLTLESDMARNFEVDVHQ